MVNNRSVLQNTVTYYNITAVIIDHNQVIIKM